MAVTPPTETPDFATGGSAAVTAPSSGKKALGWLVDERPAAQYVNWFFKWTSKWVAYWKLVAVIKDLANTFSATQTFNGPVDDPDPAIKLGSDPTANGFRHLIETMGGTGTTPKIRFFSIAGGGLAITLNAGWAPGSPDWGRDDVAKVAYRITLVNGGVRVESAPLALGDQWNDADWAGQLVTAEEIRFGNWNIASNTTSYMTPGALRYATTSGAEGEQHFIVRRPGKISGLKVYALDGPSPGTWVVTLRKNGTDTVQALTVTTGAAANSDTTTVGAAITVAAGDKLSLKVVANNLAGVGTEVLASMLFEPS